MKMIEINQISLSHLSVLYWYKDEIPLLYFHKRSDTIDFYLHHFGLDSKSLLLLIKCYHTSRRLNLDYSLKIQYWNLLIIPMNRTITYLMKIVIISLLNKTALPLVILVIQWNKTRGLHLNDNFLIVDLLLMTHIVMYRILFCSLWFVNIFSLNVVNEHTM